MHLTIDGDTVELQSDQCGWRGQVVRDGEVFLAHVTLIKTGPRATTPAKARFKC